MTPAACRPDAPRRPRSRELVERALLALRNLEHRGATGADPDTGDGAGHPAAAPRRPPAPRLARSSASSCRRPATTASAWPSCPATRRCGCAARSCACASAPRRGTARSAGATCPCDSDAIGELARQTEPVVRQLLVERPRRATPRRSSASSTSSAAASSWPRRACGVREADVHRSSRLSPAHARLQGPAAAPASSPPTTPTWRARLREPRWRSCTRGSRRTRSAPGISRTRSTSWRTTARSTRCAATAPGCPRASRSCAATLFGGDLQKLFPIADERWSDSATLDAMLELLVLGGRSLAHALAMLIPPAWSDPTLDLDDDVRAFYEYHATLVEPWDGPAAIMASRRRAGGARRSTATACARAAPCAPATGWSCSRPRSACSTSTRPRSSSPAASARAACWSSTPTPGG